jgi:hypothetical protein
MKLLTHNMLSCHIKGVQNGFPFKIEPEKVEEVDADYDPDFLRHIFPRLEWKALREAAATLGDSSPSTLQLLKIRFFVGCAEITPVHLKWQFPAACPLRQLPSCTEAPLPEAEHALEAGQG